MERGAICIFAKPPDPGRVKTRLAPALGVHGAAELARAFLVDTCASVRTLPWANAIIATTGAFDDALAAELALPRWPQGDGDLGARMERVLRRALAEQPYALAIGADSPGLPARLLDEARDALVEADAAIGPTDDGGFYVLALRRCPAGLLDGLPWSHTDTFAHTLARLRARGLTVRVLEPWFDVDRPEDLVKLRDLLGRREIVAPATRRCLDAPRISVIMPVLDEERRIAGALDDILSVPGLREVIVVDGGSTDRTFAIAREHPVRVIDAPRGRARQMNAGAAVATGSTLLFLHADTTLPPDAARHVEQVLAAADVVAGAFRTWTVADAPAPWFAPVLHAADVRSRYTHLPYGDQAMFVRADAFWRVGGFPDQPLMEDLELSRRLHALGEIRTARATVRVSGRRFVARPITYTLAVNVFPLLYRLGVPAARLAQLYRAVR